MKTLLFAVALVVFPGCPNHPSPAPVTPVGADATVPDGPATCLDLCRRGAVLDCSWAEPTPAGASCVDVCLNNQQAQITAWDLDCRTRKPTCKSMDEECR